MAQNNIRTMSRHARAQTLQSKCTPLRRDGFVSLHFLSSHPDYKKHRISPFNLESSPLLISSNLNNTIILNTEFSTNFHSLTTTTFIMPSKTNTKNTSAQSPGYPLGCSVMAKPQGQSPGYPLGCNVMAKPQGQSPGYPLGCTVM
ncbi:hypothetical protein CC79DRAFT_1364245 [Sarocladium strictum]